MDDTADRVAMRFGEVVEDAFGAADVAADIAAALSSHGLREAVEKIEHGIAHQMTSSDKIYLLQQIGGYNELLKEILTALLGEGETLKVGGEITQAELSAALLARARRNALPEHHEGKPR